MPTRSAGASRIFKPLHVARDDSYEPCRLLVPGWLASFEDKINGSPIAIVPYRSLLIAGRYRDERCLQRLIDSAEGEFEASPGRIALARYAFLRLACRKGGADRTPPSQIAPCPRVTDPAATAASYDRGYLARTQCSRRHDLGGK